MRNYKTAMFNADEAGLSEIIVVERGDFFKKIYEERPLTIITNPPYDERLELSDVELFYELMGDTLKQSYTDTSAWIISGAIEGFKRIGLRPSKKVLLYNGKIPVQFRNYEMYAGSK
jgi:putative N6-adenine-specific DNA methylase